MSYLKLPTSPREVAGPAFRARGSRPAFGLGGAPSLLPMPCGTDLGLRLRAALGEACDGKGQRGGRPSSWQLEEGTYVLLACELSH